MKVLNLTNCLVIGSVLMIAASGCRKNPESVRNIPGRTEAFPRNNPPAGPIRGDAPPRQRPLPPTEPPPRTREAVGTPLPDPDQRKDWPRDRAIFAPYTTHFAYDSSVVQSEDKSKVAAVADYLKAHANSAVEIEGHCDERGTEEYNRSLGERRALALREDLLSLGIEPRRIDTTTYGKDRPVATGHNEAAWKQNRRGEFLLETPPK
jgi:peptidoglycan-associated lipoprotein